MLHQASSAEFEGLHRPVLHVTGVLAWGHMECYFISHSDAHKDANNEATAIARTLDLVSSKLQDQVAMPRSLIVAADNTCREAKNSMFLSTLGYMHSSGRFDAVECEFMKSGHSHNELDQRFSAIATLLNTAGSLEDPFEFRDYLLDYLKPAGGRSMHIEVMPYTYDFDKLFMDMNVQVKGLSATKHEPRTNHVWRIIGRDLLHRSGMTNDAIQITHPQWEQEPKSDKDSILLLKESMHQTMFSQMPILLLPETVAQKVEPSKLELAPSKTLTDDKIKEYRKTAAAIAAPPWNLMKGQLYLNQLCDAQEKGWGSQPEPLDFIFKYKMPSMRDSVIDVPAHLKDTIMNGAVVRQVTAGALSAADKKRKLDKQQVGDQDSILFWLHALLRPSLNRGLWFHWQSYR